MKASEIIWTHMTSYDINIIEARDLDWFSRSWMVLTDSRQANEQPAKMFSRFSSICPYTSAIVSAQHGPAHLPGHVVKTLSSTPGETSP